MKPKYLGLPSDYSITYSNEGFGHMIILNSETEVTYPNNPSPSSLCWYLEHSHKAHNNDDNDEARQRTEHLPKSIWLPWVEMQLSG